MQTHEQSANNALTPDTTPRVAPLGAVCGAALLAGVFAVGCGDDGAPRGNSGGDGIGGGTAGTASMTDAGPSAGSAADSESGNGEGGGMACDDGAVVFSFLWVANSPEGTVSKIDTRTAVEVARYRTGPEPTPDPSRTSVALGGDVAVLNRAGSVTKIAALLERCVDANGDGTIQTSSGPGDILAWGADECILWNQPLPYFEPQPGDRVWGSRPVAWDGGVPNPEDACDRGPGRLWVGWYEGTDTNIAGFRRLSGSTGAILDEVKVPDWSLVTFERTRPYGAAVDREGNLWVLGAPYQLLRIDGTTLETELHYAAVVDVLYGLALDASGTPWVAQCNGRVRRFDRELQGYNNIGDAGGCLRGMAIDSEGRGWVAGNDPCRLVELDIEGGSIVNANIPLPGCVDPVGVSIDVDGKVWVVDRGADLAFKVDPDTYVVLAEVGGLVAPYTYSDMTGAGLSLQFTPEG